MNKITKLMFLSLIIISLTIGLTSISATDIQDNSTVIENVNQVSNQITYKDTNNDNNLINTPLDEEEVEQTQSNAYTTTNTIQVTPNNYQTALTTINDDTTYDFSGTFTDLGTYTFTDLDTVKFTSSQNNAYFTNTQLTVKGTKIEISNLNISNTDTTQDSVILVYDSTNVYIHDNRINTTTANDNENHAISVRTSNYVNITDNIVKTEGYHQSMGWNNSSGEWAGAILVSGIELSGTANANITLNNVTVLNIKTTHSGYESIEGITIKGSTAQNILVNHNNITVRDADYNYGTTVSAGATNVTYDNNTFNITGPHYVCAIQVDNTDYSYVLNNTIYAVANGTNLNSNEEQLAYGIILTCWNAGNSDYNTVANNNITLKSNIGYGMELFMVSYTNITNNTINVTGNKSMGIGTYQSSYNNFTSNTIRFNNSYFTPKNIYELITPCRTGIDITANSNNNILSSNKIYGFAYLALIKTVTIIDSENTYVLTDNTLSCLQFINYYKYDQDYETVSGTYYMTLPSNSVNLIFKQKTAKKDSQTIIITASNFDEYVTDGKLNDNVNAGDTLDFQGLFDHPRFKLIVNKPVNIISSTHDAYYSLNTTSTNFFGEDPGDSFVINKEGSGTNISDIEFYNTQVFLLNASNVIIDNISVINENQQIGSGVGVTSIRDQSINITVKNSYFKTKNNGGHSTLVCAWAENVLIENNTLEVEGNVGNILYFTTWNVKDSGENATNGYYNKNITVRNNVIRGKDNSIASICYAIAIEGENHLIENNYVDYAGTCISPQWGVGSQRNITFINNTITKGISNIGFAQSHVINNTIHYAALAGVNVDGNTFDQVNIQYNVNFTNNNVTSKTQITGNNVLLENNTITSTNDYAINISSSSLENITIKNNMINSNNKKGNDAINSASEYSSENNDGWTVLYINDTNMEDYFDVLEANWELGIFSPVLTWKGPDKNIIGIINITSVTRGTNMKLTGKNMFTVKSPIQEMDLDPETILFNTTARYDTLSDINNYEAERFGFVVQGTLINCILGDDYGPLFYELGMISEYTPSIKINTTFLQYIEQNRGSRIIDVFYLSDETIDFGFDGNTLKDNYGKTNMLLGNLTQSIILNKPFNITSAPGFGKTVNITLVSGSEGTNITDLTINGDLIINAEDVSVKNTTINGNLIINTNKAYIHDNNITKDIKLTSSSDSVIKDNNINGSIHIVTSDNNNILNNNIVTTNENTIESDLYSMGNNITNNYLVANTKAGENSIVKGLNNIKDNTPYKDVNVTLSLDKTTSTVLDEVTATVHITSDNDTINTGKVTLLTNGIPQNPVDIVNNEANITFTLTESGNITVKVWYLADEIYNNNCSNTTDITVNKRQTSLAVEEITGKIGQPVTVKANITDNKGVVESGNVTIITDDTNYTADIENGLIKKDIILSTSQSIIKIVYEGSDINTPVNASMLVKLEKLNSTITLTQTPTDNTSSIINIEVYGENGEIIDNEQVTLIKDNSLLSTVTLNNSKAQLITQMDEGTIITAMYRGNNKYNPISDNITIKNMTRYIKVDTINANIGDTINITARIQADNTTLNINKGKVSFKINGKTIKDSNGKIIYAKVINGIATIENYDVPESWDKENTTIQAVYSGSTECIKLNSLKEILNISAQTPTITTNNINTSVNSTITLKATINAGNNIINTGKVAFKINGKTVKNANGKVIYAKVVNNTVSIEYRLPESYMAGNYNITAVYISSNYSKLQDTKVLSIN